MKIYLLIFILVPGIAAAGGRFAIGPEVGLAVQSHTDPSGHKMAWTVGAPFGVAGVYQFAGEFSHIALDYSIGYSLLSRLTIRNVTIGGVTGTYREDLGVFHWLFGGRYYLRGGQWNPYAGLGIGFEYFKRGGVEFRDPFNALLPTPPHSDHFNLTLAPNVGIEYRPTFRWAVGVSLRVPLSFRNSGVVPSVMVPVTVQFAF